MCVTDTTAALEDRSGRSGRHLPKHAGQVQVGVVFALAKPHGVGGAIDRKRDGDMPCVMRKRPAAAPAKEQTAEKAQQYDDKFTHARFGRRQETETAQAAYRPHRIAAGETALSEPEFTSAKLTISAEYPTPAGQKELIAG